MEAVGKNTDGEVRGPRTDSQGTQPVGGYVSPSQSSLFLTPWAPNLKLPSSWPHSKQKLSLLFPVDLIFFLPLSQSQLLLQTVFFTSLLLASHAHLSFWSAWVLSPGPNTVNVSNKSLCHLRNLTENQLFSAQKSMWIDRQGLLGKCPRRPCWGPPWLRAHSFQGSATRWE